MANQVSAPRRHGAGVLRCAYRRFVTRRTFILLTLVVALMLLALPAAATPGAGFASPGSSLVEKVVEAFAGLWRVVAPEVTASPALEARAKDGDDDRGGVDTPPLSGLGVQADPDG